MKIGLSSSLLYFADLLRVCGARRVCGGLGFLVFSYLPLVSLLFSSSSFCVDMSFWSSEMPRAGRMMKNPSNFWICVKFSCLRSSITSIYRHRARVEQFPITIEMLTQTWHHGPRWCVPNCCLVTQTGITNQTHLVIEDHICPVHVQYLGLLRRCVEVCVLCFHPDSDWLNVLWPQTWTLATEEGCSTWSREEPANSSATLRITWRTPWWTPPTRLWTK